MQRYYYCLLLIAACLLSSCNQAGRQIISLNGKWEIAKTAGDLPDRYSSITTVPGLVDMAIPAIDTIVPNGGQFVVYSIRKAYDYKGWYWHRRTFDITDTSFDIIRLKICKAKYHTKVYINGKFAGENLYCFTPSYFDIKPYLKAGQKNEIIIGVGCEKALPDSIPNGYDGEKLRQIPGIYDDVEITLSNQPFIRNIQCVPNVKNKKLRVVAEIETNKEFRLKYSVAEKSTGKEVASGSVSQQIKSEDGCMIADWEIDMKSAQLWTPSSPFLYELTLNTDKDVKSVKFGMRSFRFDIDNSVAMLNEEPFYLRGTNICIYRFEEDPDRGRLPWDRQWVTTLHERFKSMHWDIARYCIGFPPEKWYDICDSLGFMVEDEYPMWALDNFPPTIKVRHLAEEYRRWIRERWNHPSVVIWDAQNETHSPVTGQAINSVRNLDLSNRPWENGWEEPAAPTDPSEAHPYLLQKYYWPNAPKEPEEGIKKATFGTVIKPFNTGRNSDGHPIIINEYGWIWLNRNGTTTTLSDMIYDKFWNGSQLTAEERLHIYARWLAMKTEYWRAHRKAAGVLHFCGLAYSRPEEPRGQTSDNFIDIRNLTFEPQFYKYMRPAFAPVGLMIDLWEKSYTPATSVNIPVYVINDLKAPFEQDVTLTLEREGKVVMTTKQQVAVAGYKVKIIPFDIILPSETGDYILKASIMHNGEEVFSERDIPIVSNYQK